MAIFNSKLLVSIDSPDGNQLGCYLFLGVAESTVIHNFPKQSAPRRFRSAHQLLPRNPQQKGWPMKGQKLSKLRQKGLEINGKINGNPGFISQIIFLDFGM